MACLLTFALTLCFLLERDVHAKCSENEIWSVFVGSQELGDVNDQLLTQDVSPAKDGKKAFSRRWDGGSSSRSVSIILTIYETAQQAKDAVENYGRGGSDIIPVSPQIGDAGYWTNTLIRPYYLICRKNVTISLFSRYARSGTVGPQDAYLRLMVERLDHLGCVPVVADVTVEHKITISSPLECTPNPAKGGDHVACSVGATDTQGHPVNYTWSCSGGTFMPDPAGSPKAMWVAPINKTPQMAEYNITATISSQSGLSAQSSFKQMVHPDERKIQITTPPQGDPNPVESQKDVTCSVQAVHPDNLPLTYTWNARHGSFVQSDPKNSKWVWQAPENTTSMMIGCPIEVTIASSDGLQASASYSQKVLGKNMLELSILNTSEIEQGKFITGQTLKIQGKLTNGGEPVSGADIGMILKPETMNPIQRPGALTRGDGTFSITYEIPRFRQSEMANPEDWIVTLKAKPLETEMGTTAAEIKVHVIPLYFQLKSVRLVQVIEAPTINGQRYLAADKTAALRVYVACPNLVHVEEKDFPSLSLALDIGYGNTDLLKKTFTFELKKRPNFPVNHSLKPLDLMIPPLEAFSQGPLLIGAIVDPEFVYTDPRDSDGMFQGIPAHVKKMKHLSLGFIPIGVPTGQGQGYEYLNTKEFKRFIEYCEKQERFIRQTYPLPSGHIRTLKTHRTYNPWRFAYKPFPKEVGARILALLLRLGIDAKLEGRILVGVLPDDAFWFESDDVSGTAHPLVPAAAVRYERKINGIRYLEPNGLTAHEVAHTYKLNCFNEEYDTHPELQKIILHNGKSVQYGGRKITGLIQKDGKVYDLEDPVEFHQAFPYPIEKDHVLCFMGAIPNRGEDRGPFYGQWVCSETYRDLFKALMDPPAEPMLYVSGLIHDDGAVTIDHLYEITQEPEPSYQGDYSIEALSATGDTLATISFGAQPGKTQPYGMTLPAPPGITRVVVKYRDTVVAERRRSPNGPVVKLRSPKGGEPIGATLHVQWEAHDLDADPLVYTVLFSHDNGKSWITLVSELDRTSFAIPSASLPGGKECLLKVMASDGFNASSDVSGQAFSVPDSKPMVFVTSPSDGSIYNLHEEVLLKAVGFDKEDQSLDDASFLWTSDMQGELGRGKEWKLSTLRLGRHKISVQLQDSSGQMAAETVTVEIIPEGSQKPGNGSQKGKYRLEASLSCITAEPVEGQPVAFLATISAPHAQQALSIRWYLNGQPVGWTGLSPKWQDPTPGAHNVTIVVFDGKEKQGKTVDFTVASATPLKPPTPTSSIIKQTFLLKSIPPSPWTQGKAFSSGDTVFVWVESQILNKPHTLEIVWIDPSGKEIKREGFELCGWGAGEELWSELKTSNQMLQGQWKIHLLVDGKVEKLLSFVLNP